jgi:hypothetical protein
MPITRETVAGKLAAYLHHKISLGDLVDWTWFSMMEGEFKNAHHNVIRDAVAVLASVMCARLG